MKIDEDIVFWTWSILHACSFAYNRDTEEYLTGTTTGVEVWKLTQVGLK